MATRGWLVVFSYLAVQTAVMPEPGIGQIPGDALSAPRRCIRGTVVSSETAMKVDATVRLEGFDYSSSGRTISGMFTFCGVSGTQTLEASAPGYEPARLEVDRDQAEGITVVLRPTRRQAPPNAAGYGASVSVESLKIPQRARDQLSRFFRAAEKKEWQKSLASLRKAVEIYPDYVDAWTNMGVVYVQLNDPQMAETSFRRALEVEPNNALIRRKLGYLYLSTGRWDQALAELNVAKSLDPTDGRTEAYIQYVRRHANQ